MKKILKNKLMLILAILLIAEIIILILPSKKQSRVKIEKKEKITSIKADKVEIIYFHSTNRCYSCQMLEQYTQQVIDQNLKDLVDQNLVQLSSINVDDPKNEKIVQKYQARGSSLYINAITNNQDNIKENTNVWQYLSNQQAFSNYLENEIRKFFN